MSAPSGLLTVGILRAVLADRTLLDATHVCLDVGELANLTLDPEELYDFDEMTMTPFDVGQTGERVLVLKGIR